MLRPVPEIITAAQKWRVADAAYKKKIKYNSHLDTHFLSVRETQDKRVSPWSISAFPLITELVK